MIPKIQLGKIFHTPGIAALMDNGLSVAKLLNRHQTGDWGEMTEKEKSYNDEAAASSRDKVCSSYDTEFWKVWIITEADRSATTVLLPEEN